MTVNVPDGDFERVIFITADALRWDFSEPYQNALPNGVWYRHTPQATFTPVSHASAFTGKNPQRHSVYNFGDRCSEDTVLDVSNAVSFSQLTTRSEFLSGIDCDTEPRRLGHKDVNGLKNQAWQADMDIFFDEDAEMVGEYDFSFIHDWLPHSSSRMYGTSLDLISNSRSIEENASAYEKGVARSVDSVSALMDKLKDAGVYEGTLFVFFGDHGQAFGEQPLGHLWHAGVPDEATCRTPLAFCSTEFEERVVDTGTNARSVDILPTLQALLSDSDLDIPISELEPFEGVDLTTFDGKLMGYSISKFTAQTGMRDAIKTSHYLYINDATGEYLLDVAPDGQNPFEYRQGEITNEPQRQRLRNEYKNVRKNSDKLILSEEVDEEFMKSMGYL